LSEGEWVGLPQLPARSAVLLFGWCAQIVSNARIPAALHRVNPAIRDRRTSLIVFCAPKHADTKLEPKILSEEEERIYKSVLVGQLRGEMGRKWRHREGTLKAEDIILEEREIMLTHLKNQDDVVIQYMIKIPN
jgi:isopenicillin N synthase-like dioxygenase